MAIKFDHTNNTIETPDGVMSPGHKNLNAIINGNFDVWQRNTSWTAIAQATVTADRFSFYHVGDMVHTVARSTDVPTYAESGVKSNYSLHADCTTVDSSIAAGDYALVRYVVEGYDYAQLAGGNATLSFWVKGTKTGTHCVSFRNSAQDRTYIAEYTIDTTNTWEKKTITVPLTETGGTWDYANGTGLEVTWALACGTTFQTTAGSWQTGSYIGTSNQVNACDNVANDFRIAQVQFEKGDTATPLEYRTFAEELALCQRYYEKSYDYGHYAGSTSQAGATRLYVGGLSSATYSAGGDVHFHATKRTTPTVTGYAPASGTSGSMRDLNAAQDITVTITNQGRSGFIYFGTLSTAGTGWNLALQWVADAEL